jgi:hypothetical protein
VKDARRLVEKSSGSSAAVNERKTRSTFNA